MRVLVFSAPDRTPPLDGIPSRSRQLLTTLTAGHTVTWLAPEEAIQATPQSLRDRLRCVAYRTEQLASPVRRWLPGGRTRPLAELASRAEGADLVVVAGDWSEPVVDSVAPPLLIDLVDSLAHDLRRRAQLTSGWQSRRWLHRSHLAATRERNLLAAARGGIAVSARASLALGGGADGTERCPMWILPPAVGLAARTSAAARQGALERHSPLLVLAGALGSFPAREGLGWWLRAVWPRLQSRRANLRLVIYGKGAPGRRLEQQANEAGARIVAEGASLGELLGRATLAVEPTRCGTGASALVLQAWAHGVPVVASSWAVGGTMGRRGRDLRVADDPHDWIETVLELLEDRDARLELAMSARSRLQKDYSSERQAERLQAALEATIARS